jgi:hypothetical protein
LEAVLLLALFAALVLVLVVPAALGMRPPHETR